MSPQNKKRKRNSVVVVCEDIRSAYNIGAIFRSADAIGVRHVYLCGITPDATSPKVKKTALGASQTVPSSHHWNIQEVIELLKKGGYDIIGVERTKKAKMYFNYTYPEKVALVVGNEVKGITRDVQKCCNQIVQIPMKGKKESLNVSIAFSLVAYEIYRQKIC